MYSNDVLKFMDDINVIFEYLEQAVAKRRQNFSFKMQDFGEYIQFSVDAHNHLVPLINIAKMDEDSLHTIYSAIADKYVNRFQVGAFAYSVDGKWDMNLAPTIAGNTVIEFIPTDEGRKKWFYEEMMTEATDSNKMWFEKDVDTLIKEEEEEQKRKGLS